MQFTTEPQYHRRRSLQQLSKTTAITTSIEHDILITCFIPTTQEDIYSFTRSLILAVQLKEDGSG